MFTFVLQDWIAVASTGVADVIQTQDDWLDLSPFQDVFLYVSCTEVSTTSAVHLTFETSPTADAALFVAIATQLTLTGGVISTVQAPMLQAAVPIARYLRWRLSCAVGPYDATFRVVVAANSPGMS
jgi:hypothetical protein